MRPPEIDDGLVKLSFAAVVLNDDIGRPAFFVNRPLGLFPAIEFFLGPPPPQSPLRAANLGGSRPSGPHRKWGPSRLRAEWGRRGLPPVCPPPGTGREGGPSAAGSADEASVPGTGVQPPRHGPRQIRVWRLRTDRRYHQPQRRPLPSALAAPDVLRRLPPAPHGQYGRHPGAPAPKSTSISATSDLPLAMPPTRPMVFMRSTVRIRPSCRPI